jgi:hypothetical protein
MIRAEIGRWNRIIPDETSPTLHPTPRRASQIALEQGPKSSKVVPNAIVNSVLR